MVITKEISMDLLSPGSPQILHAMQGDSMSRVVKINLFCNGAKWEIPSEVTFSVCYCKRDGTGGKYGKIDTGDGVVSPVIADSNTLTVTLAPQALSCAGMVRCEVIMSSSKTILSTFTFFIDVQKSAENDIKSEDYWLQARQERTVFLRAEIGAEADVYKTFAASEFLTTAHIDDAVIGSDGYVAVVTATSGKSVTVRARGWKLFDESGGALVLLYDDLKGAKGAEALFEMSYFSSPPKVGAVVLGRDGYGATVMEVDEAGDVTLERSGRKWLDFQSVDETQELIDASFLKDASADFTAHEGISVQQWAVLPNESDGSAYRTRAGRYLVGADIVEIVDNENAREVTVLSFDDQFLRIDRWLCAEPRAELVSALSVDGETRRIEIDGLNVALPYYSSKDIGKALTIGSDGAPTWGDERETLVKPVLAAGCSWYKSSTPRGSITEIEIVDRYTPTGDESESWDASDGEAGTITAYINGTKLTIAGNGYGCIFANEDSSYLFSNSEKGANSDKTKIFTAVSEISGAPLLNFSECKNIAGLLSFCIALKAIDTGSWVFDKAENAAGVLANCRVLPEIDVSSWGMGRVKSFASTVFCCYELKSLDVGKWDVGSAETMASMFSGCSALESLNVGNWAVGSVTTMASMFSGCSALTSLNVGNWDVSSVKNMSGMFKGCLALESLNPGNWDVSSVTTMSSMFSMSNLGADQSSLASLNLSKWNPKSCTSMSFMFYALNGLTEPLDVSGWDVSNVTTFDHMLAHSRAQIVGVETWKFGDTCACITLNAMFHTCKNTTLDVSNFKTKSVTSFGQMFENATATKIIGLDQFDTSNGLGFEEMFNNAYMLSELDLSSFDTRKAKDGEFASNNGGKTETLKDMLKNMQRLRKITLGANFTFRGDGTGAAANHAVLPTPDATYITGATGLWYSAGHPEGQTPAEVAETHSGTVTYYALAEEVT